MSQNNAKLSALEAMSQNRKERRRFSKLNNGIKIPGINIPHKSRATVNLGGIHGLLPKNSHHA